MKSVKELSDKLGLLVVAKATDKYAYSVTESEIKEFNLENSEFKLLRTTFDKRCVVTLFNENRKGMAAGNDLTENGLNTTVESAYSIMQSSDADDANDIAESEGYAEFNKLPADNEEDKFFDRLVELRDEIVSNYKKINLGQMIGRVRTSHSIYRNSNKTEFVSNNSTFSVTLEIAGHEGDKTTGMSYTNVTLRDLSKPLIEVGGFRKCLEDAEASLNETVIGDKFEGTAIITPDCFGNFLYSLVGNYADGSTVFDGTSQWKDKLNKAVADKRFSLMVSPELPEYLCNDNFTNDGYKSVPLTIIENGVLKNFQYDLYYANKMGCKASRNGDNTYYVPAGDKSLAQIIKETKRGLIVGAFSGGNPSANGEFSGVAKNSFYVEDGVIKGAVNETMISGNLAGMLNNIIDISSDVIADGATKLPYIAVGGITISGK